MKAPIFIIIKSCDRPASLERLLADLKDALADSKGAAPPNETAVSVWDDASVHDMARPIAQCQALGGTWHRREVRAGKSHAWRHHNDIYQHLRAMPKGAVALFFDDDMRLCDRFFERALLHWEALPKDKVTLHFMVDERRDGAPCWTGIRATNVSKQLRRTQWVDGSFMCNRRMLEAIDWTLKPIDPERWTHKTGRSTGCGEQLSLRLHAQGLGMYQVRESLLVHVNVPSVYHPSWRRAEPLRTLRFVDGPAAAARLGRTERTEASLASIRARKRIMLETVRALLPQVDIVRVYLNGYGKVPLELEHPRIVVGRSEDHGDRGDAGKFFWAAEAQGYQLSCDDDLRYPSGYAAHVIAAIERYKRRAVVGFHGVMLKEPVRRYYADRFVTHFSVKVDKDTPQHLLGTGTVAYHASTLTVHPDDFPHPNMADIWFARLCQRAEVPMVMIARGKQYLTGVQTPDQIFDRAIKDDSRQSAIVNELSPWRLHGAGVNRATGQQASRPRPAAPRERQRGSRPRRLS